MANLSDAYNNTDCKGTKQKPTKENVENIIRLANMNATVKNDETVVVIAPAQDTNVLKLANVLHSKLLGGNRMSISPNEIKLYK